MRDLLDLVKIVTKAKLRSVELIGSEDGRTSKLEEFYNLLVEERFKDDDEAAAYFYGGDKRSPSYQKLRKMLKDRLINYLFIIDLKQPSYTDRQTAYYECYREWAAAKILFGKYARDAAVPLARKILKIARKYEITELIVDVCHTLRLYHGTIEGDHKKFQQYNKGFKLYEEIWREENRAEEYYIELSIAFINSKATKTEFQDKARAYYDQVREAMDKHDSYYLHLCGRLIEISIYTSVNDYENTLDVCDRGIAFFDKKPFVANVPLQVFHYQKFICHVQMRQFEQALAEAELCLQHMEEGSFNWFKVFELYFLLYMHSREYEEAEEVFQRATTHDDFQKLPSNIQETWKISEAYLYFLEKADQLSAGEPRHDKFRLARFLNEIELFSKDKQGMNIPVILVELLIRLVDKDYDGYIDRREAVNKYRQRYLKDEETQRSNLFLQMLLQVPKCDFNREEVEEKTAETYQNLQELSIDIANQTHEIEVLPYEHLWEIVQGCLA